MAEEQKVLELSTGDRTRRTVIIDGKPYQLRDPDELTLQQQFGLAAIGKKAANLPEPGSKEEEAVIADVGAALKKAVKIIMVDLPDSVLDGLADGQRIQILSVFPKPARQAPEAPAGRVNGAS